MPPSEILWVTALGAALTGGAAWLSAWATHRKHQRDDRAGIHQEYKTLVDALSARVDALSARVETLEREAERRARVIRSQGDYIGALRQHIIDGKPAPPPPPPDPDDTI